jgi:hypothetical protein
VSTIWTIPPSALAGVRRNSSAVIRAEWSVYVAIGGVVDATSSCELLDILIQESHRAERWSSI